MDQPAPHTPPTDQPGPPQDRAAPGRIAGFLQLVRVLLGYGRHLDKTLSEQAAQPRFPTLAAGFGTHDLRRIAAHIQRGIMRLMMLERVLLARAAQGRDIEPTPLPEPAEPAEIEALDIKLRAPSQASATPSKDPNSAPDRRPITDPDDPLNFVMPTMKELEAQVRSRPIGRTITDICLDLGINPSICDGRFWNEIYEALWYFGGSFEQLHNVRERRREAFQKERDKLPDTWTWQIWDRPREAIREMLGYVLGEPPPDPGLAIAPT
jgi:hypothetical protein